MASQMFRFTARWKEELAVEGPGGALILELPMGELTAYLPTEQAWPTVAPKWATDLWSELKAELEQWCLANKAELVIGEGATVSPYYAPSIHSAHKPTNSAGWLGGAVLLLVIAIWFLIV